MNSLKLSGSRIQKNLNIVFFLDVIAVMGIETDSDSKKELVVAAVCWKFPTQYA